MKKLLLLLTFFIAFTLNFVSGAYAENIFKITSANIDTSNALISLTSNNLSDMADIKSIKVVKLSNPTRVYFDLPDTILAGSKKDWQFESSGIKHVKISQFSTNPHIVRVVINYDDGFDISSMQFLQVQNNLIIKFKNSIAQNPFMQNTYRDDHSSSSDFYEYMTVSAAVSQNDAISQINNAFNSQSFVKQELRLNTKFYVDRVSAKNGAVLLGGMGSVGIEKPMILTNPSRIIFDLPNTLVNPALRNKEYSLGGSDKFRIGQFSVNKARVVITTPDVTKYIPIYAKDNQSLLIGNTEKISYGILPSADGSITGYSNAVIDKQSSAMTLNFSTALVHGFDRTNTEVIAYLYNITAFNDYDFEKAFAGTAFAKAKITNQPKGLKLTIPIEYGSLVTAFTGADGKSLKIQIKAPRQDEPKTTQTVTPAQPAKTTEVQTPSTPKGTSGKHKVVIDAGHGGSDVGATRNGAHEKFITLDVAKRVEKLLKAQGYGVLMTRTGDTYVSLADRVAYSEEYQPDIFVSIHVNSSTSESSRGIETHYYHQESIPLAQSVHSSLVSAISNSPNRGLFKSKFYVINHTTDPAILVEIGFISNTSERAALLSESRKQATAKAIVEGINNYFKNSK